MSEIPKKLLSELAKVQVDSPKAHIAYNANIREYFICYLSINYYSSLMIIRP